MDTVLAIITENHDIGLLPLPFIGLNDIMRPLLSGSNNRPSQINQIKI